MVDISNNAEMRMKIHLAYVLCGCLFYNLLHASLAPNRAVGRFGNVNLEYPSADSMWGAAWPEGIRLFNRYNFYCSARLVQFNFPFSYLCVNFSISSYSLRLNTSSFSLNTERMSRKVFAIKPSTYSWQEETLVISVKWPSASNPRSSKLVPPLAWLRSSTSKVVVLPFAETPKAVSFAGWESLPTSTTPMESVSDCGSPFTIEEMRQRLWDLDQSASTSFPQQYKQRNQIIDGEEEAVDNDSVVEISVHKDMADHSLTALRRFGLSRRDIFRLLEKAPWILALDVSHALPRLGHALVHDLHFTVPEAVHIVTHGPYLLAQYHKQRGRDVLSTFQTLVACGYNKAQLKADILRFPNILATPPHRLQSWRQLLRWHRVALKAEVFGRFLRKREASFVFSLDAPDLPSRHKDLPQQQPELEQQRRQPAVGSRSASKAGLGTGSSAGLAEEAHEVLDLLHSLCGDAHRCVLDVDKLVRSAPELLLVPAKELQQRLLILATVLSARDLSQQQLHQQERALHKHNPQRRRRSKTWNMSDAGGKHTSPTHVDMFSVRRANVDLFSESAASFLPSSSSTSTAMRPVNDRGEGFEKPQLHYLLAHLRSTLSTPSPTSSSSSSSARTSFSSSASTASAPTTSPSLSSAVSLSSLSPVVLLPLTRFLQAYPRTLLLSQTQLLRAIETLERPGGVHLSLSRMEIAGVVRREPRVLQRSPEVLEGVWALLCGSAPRSDGGLCPAREVERVGSHAGSLSGSLSASSSSSESASGGQAVGLGWSREVARRVLLAHPQLWTQDLSSMQRLVAYMTCRADLFVQDSRAEEEAETKAEKKADGSARGSSDEVVSRLLMSAENYVDVIARAEYLLSIPAPLRPQCAGTSLLQVHDEDFVRTIQSPRSAIETAAEVSCVDADDDLREHLARYQGYLEAFRSHFPRLLSMQPSGADGQTESLSALVSSSAIRARQMSVRRVSVSPRHVAGEDNVGFGDASALAQDEFPIEALASTDLPSMETKSKEQSKEEMGKEKKTSATKKDRRGDVARSLRRMRIVSS